jgi:hypothetical protein
MVDDNEQQMLLMWQAGTQKLRLFSGNKAGLKE